MALVTGVASPGLREGLLRGFPLIGELPATKQLLVCFRRAVEKLDHGGIDEIVALSLLTGRSLLEGHLDFEDVEALKGSLGVAPSTQCG
eukprot:5460924-Amphidinium_carterae.1